MGVAREYHAAGEALDLFNDLRNYGLRLGCAQRAGNEVVLHVNNYQNVLHV